MRKLAEELPEYAWDNLRDSERKEIWCDMACLHRVRDGLPGPESWLIIRKEENGKKKMERQSPNAYRMSERFWR